MEIFSYVTIENIARCCRLCLKLKSNIPEIFVKLENNLMSEIYLCTNTKVAISDGPTGICEQCFQEIKRILFFRKRCAKINEFLENVPKMTKIENNIISSENIIDASDMITIKSGNSVFGSKNGLMRNKMDKTCPKPITSQHKSKKPYLQKEQVKPSTTYAGLCFICGILIPNLNRHLRTHLGGYDFICDLCGKHLRTKFAMYSHLMQHTKSGKFTCEDCDRSFVVRARYIRHRRTHTLEKPFSCKFCNKHFYSSHNVMIHERIHTGERPYSCPECQVSYGHSYLLKQHTQRVHKF